MTFKSDFDNADNYGKRHSALMEAFRRFNAIEERTTSCVFLGATATVKDVELALYGALDYRKDEAIVLQTFRHSPEFFGPK